MRGIIEFSNVCVKNCLYCGLRRGNKKLFRYRLSVEEILAACRTAQALGIRTVVLQSGEDPFYSRATLCRLIKRIKQDCNLAITLSLGEKRYSDLKSFRDAGAERYLLKFETSDERLYRVLKPDSSFSRRFLCLESLRRLDFQVGSGTMLGLPGQTDESMAQDILLFRDLQLDMVGVGPFLAHPETPLAGTKKTSLELVLKVIALTRLVTENAHIPATTATGTLDSNGRKKALLCGANVIMPNMTPREFRKHYQIYPEKICIDEESEKCYQCITGMVRSIGRTIARGFGHSKK